MKIKYADDIVEEIENRGKIQTPNNCVNGDAFEEWLMGENNMETKLQNEELEEYKRANNDTWICNQLEELVFKYEKYLKTDEEKDLDEYEKGEHNELLAVVTELKEILYKK